MKESVGQRLDFLSKKFAESKWLQSICNAFYSLCVLSQAKCNNLYICPVCVCVARGEYSFHCGAQPGVEPLNLSAHHHLCVLSCALTLGLHYYGPEQRWVHRQERSEGYFCCSR